MNKTLIFLSNHMFSYSNRKQIIIAVSGPNVVEFHRYIAHEIE